MMLLKTKGIIWSYIGLIWPYWKSLELNYFTNIYLNECISIVLLSLLEKRTVNRSFSFRNPKESWISSFVMIVEISTEHRALNHIPFIYLIFLGLHGCWAVKLLQTFWHHDPLSLSDHVVKLSHNTRSFKTEKGSLWRAQHAFHLENF